MKDLAGSQIMRISHIILLLVALAGCVVCYFAGYRAGTKESPVRESREGDLLIALRTYQSAERTNWTKVQSVLGMQVLALTRDYERRFSAPGGTSSFARYFAEARAVADRIESRLLPLGAVLSNVPTASNVKVTVDRER